MSSLLSSSELRSGLVDSAVYVSGERVATPASLSRAFDCLRGSTLAASPDRDVPPGRRGSLRSYLRGVGDDAVSVNEEGFRFLLRDILTVNATLVAQCQKEELPELS